VDKDTEIKLQEISDEYDKHKEVVIKHLLERVALVQPEAHRNLKKVA
jgi:V-type H+-transporting ATPase subunit G